MLAISIFPKDHTSSPDIPIDVFISTLRVYGTDVSVRPSTHPYHPFPLLWQATIKGEAVAGMVDLHTTHLQFRASRETAAELVWWFRTLIPPDYTLWLIVDVTPTIDLQSPYITATGQLSMDITSTITPEDILACLPPNPSRKAKPVFETWRYAHGALAGYLQIPPSRHMATHALAALPNDRWVALTAHGEPHGFRLWHGTLDAWKEVPCPMQNGVVFFQWWKQDLWIIESTQVGIIEDGIYRSLSLPYPEAWIVQAATTPDQLWVATQDSLWTWEHTRWVACPLPPEAANISALHADRAGRLWLAYEPHPGAPHHIQVWDADRWTHIPTPDNKHFRFLYTLYMDVHTHLWVSGSDIGLWRWDGTVWERWTSSQAILDGKRPGLTSNTILACINDAQGNLWALTTNGLCHYDSTTWYNHCPSVNQ